MDIDDRKIEGPSVLRHRQMDSVRMHIPPAQRKGFRLAKTGEKEKPVTGGMDRVLEPVDRAAPCSQIPDDPPVRLFRIPFDCNGRGLLQVVGAPRMVPD
jgi:hypothetical protein